MKRQTALQPGTDLRYQITLKSLIFKSNVHYSSLYLNQEYILGKRSV